MRLWPRRRLNLKRCLIPEGFFEMGSAAESFDEGPVHRVYVSAFEMSQFPVRNSEYAIFLKRTGADPPPWWGKSGSSAADQPVVGVNWVEARRYCEWLSQETGLNTRLPTEAEFEKAARGGLQQAVYPWGDRREDGRYEIERGPLEAPYACGRNPPNGFGLYDMVSNVHQWCHDGYDPNYYDDSPERNPRGREGSTMRSARGASYKEADLIGRCAARASLSPYFRVADFGFRWVIGYERGVEGRI